MRLIDTDEIEYYSDETGNEIAYKVDIDQLPTITQSGWVSVEDRLPEQGERVLATDGAFVGEGYTNCYGVWCRPNGLRWDMLDSDVTHWMPLPEPPKED